MMSDPATDHDLSVMAATTEPPPVKAQLYFTRLLSLRVNTDPGTGPMVSATVELTDVDIYSIIIALAELPGVPVELRQKGLDFWWALKKSRLAPPEF